MGAAQDENGIAVFAVRVQPRASRNAIYAGPDGQMRVALTAPPVEGAANEALVAFVAKALGVSKSRVEVRQGVKSREKLLAVTGMSANEVEMRLLGE